MILALLGLGVGLLLGSLCPLTIAGHAVESSADHLLAALDSVFGGFRSVLDDRFDDTIFMSGFFVNGLLAAFLVYAGDRLGIDLYYVALLAFGLRIFQNLAIIRRYYLRKHR